MFDNPGERLLLRQPFGNFAPRFRMAIEIGKAIALTWRGPHDVCDSLVDLGLGGGNVSLERDALEGQRRMHAFARSDPELGTNLVELGLELRVSTRLRLV